MKHLFQAVLFCLVLTFGCSEFAKQGHKPLPEVLDSLQYDTNLGGYLWAEELVSGRFYTVDSIQNEKFLKSKYTVWNGRGSDIYKTLAAYRFSGRLENGKKTGLWYIVLLDSIQSNSHLGEDGFYEFIGKTYQILPGDTVGYHEYTEDGILESIGYMFGTDTVYNEVYDNGILELKTEKAIGVDSESEKSYVVAVISSMFSNGQKVNRSIEYRDSINEDLHFWLEEIYLNGQMIEQSLNAKLRHLVGFLNEDCCPLISYKSKSIAKDTLRPNGISHGKKIETEYHLSPRGADLDFDTIKIVYTEYELGQECQNDIVKSVVTYPMLPLGVEPKGCQHHFRYLYRDADEGDFKDVHRYGSGQSFIKHYSDCGFNGTLGLENLRATIDLKQVYFDTLLVAQDTLYKVVRPDEISEGFFFRRRFTDADEKLNPKFYAISWSGEVIEGLNFQEWSEEHEKDVREYEADKEARRRYAKRLRELEEKAKTYSSNGARCSRCTFGQYYGGSCNTCGKVAPDRLIESIMSRAACSMCNGTGRERLQGRRCPMCSGKGYRSY